MPLCKNCGHPHGWYDGLCAACASKVVTAAPEEEEAAAPEVLEIESEITTDSTGSTVEASSGRTTETVVEEEPQPEPEPEPKKKSRVKRAK